MSMDRVQGIPLESSVPNAVGQGRFPWRRPEVEQARRWLAWGFWSVMDQGLFAGTNFLAGVLLARWLAPATYGAVSTAYAVFLLLSTFHLALWAEPMLVFGSGRLQAGFAAYRRILLRYHWVVTLPAGLVFLLVGLGLWALGAPELGMGFVGLAVTIPGVLFLWFTRRETFALLAPHLAAWGGGLYLVLYLGLVGGLQELGWLNPATAMAAMGGAALGAGLWVHHALGQRVGGLEKLLDAAQVLRMHWSYGRWTLFAGLFAWVPSNIAFVLLPWLAGLEATAHFRALTNLIMPVLHLNAALGSLLVPLLVRARPHGHVRTRLLVFLGARMVLALAYWALLAWTGSKWMALLYAHKYSDVGLAWLGGVAVAEAVYMTFQAYLLAMERPGRVAWGYLVVALVAVPGSWWLIRESGVPGAVLAMLWIKGLLAVVFLGLSRAALPGISR